MDATAIRGRSARTRVQRIRGPLVGSAAAHLLLLALFLLVGTSVDTHIEQVVPVILVEGAASSRVGATKPPAPVKSSSEADRDSPRSSTPGPADEAATPPRSTARPMSSTAAATSSETVPHASNRDGTAASPPDSRSGATFPESGEATSGNGGAPPGTGTAGTVTRLREKIQSAIVYPDEAVRRGLEGDVLLRIRIGVGGSPGDIRVAKSSGARILDEAARQGVVRAAPLPSDPGWVEVPVRFLLRRTAGERP